VHGAIEMFATHHSINAAALIVLGSADEGSTLVVGPRKGRTLPIEPMTHILQNVHEVAGVGTVFPDDEDKPVLQMHMACGRRTETNTGCVHQGVRIWHVMEIILFELLDSTGLRLQESASGFKLLNP
jgi:predicted DNA-binding protein with PD1-like motif